MSAWCVLTASGACLRSILQKVVKTSSDRPENRKTTWTKGCTAVIFRYQSRPNSSASARTERGGRGEGVFATETAVSGSQSARCEPHRLPPDPRGSFGGSSQPAEARAAGAAGGIRRGPWSVVIFIGTPGTPHRTRSAPRTPHRTRSAPRTPHRTRSAPRTPSPTCCAPSGGTPQTPGHRDVVGGLTSAVVPKTKSLAMVVSAGRLGSLARKVHACYSAFYVPLPRFYAPVLFPTSPVLFPIHADSSCQRGQARSTAAPKTWQPAKSAQRRRPLGRFRRLPRKPGSR